MATTIGSLDLNAFSDLYSDSTQYFWFEGNASASYGAGAHVTLVPDTSFISNPTGQNILMNTDGFSIRNGLLPMMTLDNNSLDFNMVDTTDGTYTNVASFGTISTIGVSDGTQAYMFLNYRSIQGIDKEGDTYFYVSDLRDANGEYLANDTFIGDGVTTVFPLGLNVFSNLVVKVNDVEQTINVDYTYDSASWYITFTSPPANDAIINATYISKNQNAKAYTLGNRAPNSTIGGMSLAEGKSTTASGYSSHAEGIFTVSSAPYSHAEGSKTTASGYSSHAEGGETIASKISAHAEGNVTTASGEGAHAEGLRSVASGLSAHAEGARTTASAQSAHAEGGETTASGYQSHAEGLRSVASGQSAHAEGGETEASALGAHAEGNATTASEQSAHAEGMRSVASGSESHAEGTSTTASGLSAHAEGNQTIASGQSTHAEGAKTEASGLSAHAEGNVTTASGQSAHAEGMRSVASGSESHAQNWRTKASSFAQTAIGKCNIEDTTDKYALIIGNGTADDARSNALTVDWNGDITVNNHSSSIGTVLSHVPSSDVSCATGKYYQLAYLELDPGIWMVDYVGGFPNTNTTGIRDTFVTSATSGYNNVTTAPSSIGNITRDRRNGEAHIIYCKASFPINVTSTTTYRVIGYQNSGQTNAVSGRMYAVRIQ